MTAPRVSDHALLRLLERSGLPVEEVRTAIEASLARAHAAAVTIGGMDHLIAVDGLVFVVRGGVVTTVTRARSPGDLARLLNGGAPRR